MLFALYSLILIEGFITISVEILAIRQLIPFVGNNVLVTSLIIGVFLLFLAIGYWRGGFHKSNFYQHLIKNLSIAACFIGIGLSYVFIDAYFGLLRLSGISFSFFFLLIYLLLILAPIVYYLGQTVPLSTNLFNQAFGVAKISSKALFISTLGSFCGAILTSALLFTFLGVAWTVVINYLSLACLCTLLAWRTRSAFRWALGLWLLGFIVFFLNVSIENNYFVKTNAYSNYRVFSIPKSQAMGKGKVFLVNRSFSSYRGEDGRSFPYIEMIKDFLFSQLKLSNARILIIGAGGFSLESPSHNNNKLTYVDIDPQIKKTAEKHFLEEKIKGKFIGQDARVFLRTVDKVYDVVLSDTYKHEMTIPSYLVTEQYFHQARKALKEGGWFILNLIASSSFDESYARNIDTTVRSVFPYCFVIPLTVAKPTTNILYFCPKTKTSGKIYTDDKNSVTLDYFFRSSLGKR